jgi:Polyglycine hydrolase-like, structural repeat
MPELKATPVVKIENASPLRSTSWMAVLLLLAAVSSSGAQNYRLPFKGEDMKPGERIYTGDHAPGIQGEGEDFGALRYLGSGKWSAYEDGGDGTSNSDFVVYEKPVYAIADGTIVGCWRNAPENPNPPAHHQKFTDGFIPGGGNMLFVDLPDGKRLLYAHMIPGTMPAKLCPNNDEYFPKAMTIPEGDAYLMLDPADQVAIKKGDFLGKVGNSGSSSGPHLHLHAEKSGAAAIMKFEQGLFKPYVDGNTDIQGGWKSFAGQEIPDGEVLIRPPRETPYRMADFEAYPVDGGLMYAGIFEPGTYGPMALFKSDWKDFLAGWQAIEKKGYRMKDLEVYPNGKGLTYAGIFEPGTYGPMALFKNNWNDFLAGWQAIEKKGYRMKDLEVYPNGNGLTYAGIFEPGKYNPMALFKSNWKDFLAGWQAIEKKGYRMKDLEVYKNGNSLTYAGIFEPGTYGPMALFKNNWNDFLAGWQAIEKKGYRMKDLEVYKDGGKLTYAGIFEPGKYNPAALFIKNDWDGFVEAWQTLE